MRPLNYKRRYSSSVHIGNTPLGSAFPIRIQSMANVSTMDTSASIQQAIRVIDNGTEYIRFTAQGEREAHNLKEIRKGLSALGYNTPLVADIHFNPKAADVAATVVEKVRINPGNYIDKVKTFDTIEYSDAEYLEELKKLRERFVPFLHLCKEQKTAIRIGVNHGSLSDRIMSRYGDTIQGMVASCMEFLRICVDEQFADVVISMKASNTVVMTQAVRLLVKTMEEEGMNYPLHLGVTEAGDGEDGRIKSAVGIGALLQDGIGDTIRVSLSEEPENELPVARKLVNYIVKRSFAEFIPELEVSLSNLIDGERRKTNQVNNIGGNAVPVVVSNRIRHSNEYYPDCVPDFIYIGMEDVKKRPELIPTVIDAEVWEDRANHYPLFRFSQVVDVQSNSASLKFLLMDTSDVLSEDCLRILSTDSSVVILLTTSHTNPTGAVRSFVYRLIATEIHTPIVLALAYEESEKESLQIKSAVDYGTLLLDGFVDGVMLMNDAFAPKELDNISFAILQATRTRISKTEYISCPGCGRTLFDLQTTIAKVKKATSHLKGLKIGIMGCIVNGPGEMADADYGYVGAGRGCISLYKGKSCIKKNIPEEDAVKELIDLIKENGDWKGE